jgi:anaerobic selenocysteine-containing dehydrogenase
VQWPCPSTNHNNRGTAKRYISREYAEKVFGRIRKKYRTGYVTLFDQHMEQKKYPGPINYYGHHPFHAGANDKAIIRVLTAGLDYEMPDEDYPYALNTGRVIEHWHSGTMTMRVRMLRELSPSAYVEVSPQDADGLGIKNGDPLRLMSRRGEITLPVWVTDRARPGMVFVPWFDQGMLINLLTVDVPESWSGAGQPDFKVCAVKLKKA